MFHLDLTVQGPLPQTCSNLFTLDLTVQGSLPSAQPLDMLKLDQLEPHHTDTPPPTDMFKLVHYEARTEMPSCFYLIFISLFSQCLAVAG